MLQGPEHGALVLRLAVLRNQRTRLVGPRLVDLGTDERDECVDELLAFGNICLGQAHPRTVTSNVLVVERDDRVVVQAAGRALLERILKVGQAVARRILMGVFAPFVLDDASLRRETRLVVEDQVPEPIPLGVGSRLLLLG